jgi:hypothetical protein
MNPLIEHGLLAAGFPITDFLRVLRGSWFSAFPIPAIPRDHRFDPRSSAFISGKLLLFRSPDHGDHPFYL